MLCIDDNKYTNAYSGIQGFKFLVVIKMQMGLHISKEKNKC